MFVYIASPYSHSNITVMQERYEQIVSYISEEYNGPYKDIISYLGIILFSPIVYFHNIAVRGGLERTADFYWNINRAILDISSSMRIVKLDGWNKSIGVKQELEYFKAKNRPIVYVQYKG